MAIWHFRSNMAHRHAGNMKLHQPIQPYSCGAQVALVLCLTLVAAAVTAGELTVEVSGISPDRGKVYVAVYDRPETFPAAGRQRVGQVLEPTAQSLIVHFKDLPPGEYAAVAYQDFNGNGKLDKSFLGIPKEPYGFSNGARGSAGPPPFSAAAVTVRPDGTTRIVLK
jgi:uncharacterized protein (DUF2141 family)